VSCRSRSIQLCDGSCDVRSQPVGRRCRCILRMDGPLGEFFFPTSRIPKAAESRQAKSAFQPMFMRVPRASRSRLARVYTPYTKNSQNNMPPAIPAGGHRRRAPIRERGLLGTLPSSLAWPNRLRRRRPGGLPAPGPFERVVDTLIFQPLFRARVFPPLNRLLRPERPYCAVERPNQSTRQANSRQHRELFWPSPGIRPKDAQSVALGTTLSNQ
jgi:hypothetical protein